DAAPELRVTGVTIPPGDRGEIADVGQHPLSVDGFEFLFSRQEPPVEEVVFELEDRLRRSAAPARGRWLCRSPAAASLGGLCAAGVVECERDYHQRGRSNECLAHRASF